MGREKRNPPAALAGGPKERHRRAQRPQYNPKAPVPDGFVAKPTAPKTKHQSYFEFVKNTDKKKKLEFQVTSKKSPPPGFEFVPIGNPELTSACKELSRSKDAMIFIVSSARDTQSTNLAYQVHRIGHHVRQIIAEEARNNLQQPTDDAEAAADGQPEPIPESQEEYNQQVDAAIRDLFPRIPNTDRQEIIEHAFTRGAKFKGEKPVGLSAEITLARRVQLAVLAHIRHNHTRYDVLLRETSWQNARKVVESLCLDILVKWRGDEETGRDQLDEILREVVIISDSEDDDDELETDNTSNEDVGPFMEQQQPAFQVPMLPEAIHQGSPRPTLAIDGTNLGSVSGARLTMSNRVAGKRGFKRYRAWNEALRRNQAGETQGPRNADHDNYGSQQVGFPEAASSGSQQRRDTLGSRLVHGSLSTMNHTSRPFGNEYPSPRTLAPLNPSALARPSYPHITHTGHEHVANERAAHQPVSTVTNGFQDLLVRSIEPASPDAPQSYYIRTLPPRNSELMPRSPLSRSYRPTRPKSPPRELLAAHGNPYPSRRVVSDQLPQESGVHGSYVNNPTFSASLPRNQHRLLSRYDEYSEQPRPVSLSRPGVLDSIQSNRIVIDAPRPGERSNPILMEDRGGYYERVPVSSTIDTASSMPAFVTIQRSVPESDRIPYYPGDVPYEPGLDLRREGQFYHPTGIETHEPRQVSSTQPPRIYIAPPRPVEHNHNGPWIARRQTDDPNYRGGLETARYPAPRVEYAVPPPQHHWTERTHHDPTPDTLRRHEPVPQVYHNIGDRPQITHDAATRQHRYPPQPEHIIVLD